MTRKRIDQIGLAVMVVTLIVDAASAAELVRRYRRDWVIS